MWIRDIDLR